MGNGADFFSMFEGCDDLELLLDCCGKTSDTMTDADRIRFLRVIMAFLGLWLKVDLKLSI